VVRAIEAAVRSVAGVALLDVTSDADHNRSVLTFAGEAEPVLEAAVAAVVRAAALIDMRAHTGVHPRMGSADVVPFVPLGATTMEDCIAVAHRAGERIWREAGVPVYFYESAARRPWCVRLENVRRGGIEELRRVAAMLEHRMPDIGGPAPHPTAGATAVGARKFLVAWNVHLDTVDASVARSIARSVRESSGGFPCVKALGFELPSAGRVQVSMNLTDVDRTRISAVYAAIESLAAETGTRIAGAELIGLIPKAAWEDARAAGVPFFEFGPDRVIEHRIEAMLTTP
jgi:glutamate formiminotransferase